MSNEITIEKLREEVNPVFNTAQSCLQILAITGDQDSETLRVKLGFKPFGADAKKRTENVPPYILQALGQIMPALNATVEARFFSFLNFMEQSGTKQVLDLPCGYTARGIKVANSGIRYFGADLPAVIDAVDPAVRELIGDNRQITYSAVDATNYTSLKKALQGAEGELHITTEGLLMYFTQSELETVFGNIRKLLLEYGGRWVTFDNEITAKTNELVAAVISGISAEAGIQIANAAAGAASQTTVQSNIFFDEDAEKAKKFVADMGFDLELVPLRKYLPETLRSLEGIPEDKRRNAMEILGSINIWVMTAKPGTVEQFTCDEKSFHADVRLTEGTLNVSLTGRLDTITAPGLLSLFREAEEKGSIKEIVIDMKNLEYISSAGLRVLLIMRKAVADETACSLLNMNEAVTEIFETTGFADIFS